MGTFLVYFIQYSQEVRIVRTSEEVIDLIVRVRTRKAISLSELARRTGIAKSTLSRYESGSRTFPLNKAETFAVALGVDVGSLLGLPSSEIANLYGKLSSENKRKVIMYIQKLMKHQQNS
ncbi:XRE family transcriptional regulator [Levilactobacillus parabrevis]|nr:XRE family transcriptional regulator [Levilactobacillus parabrevis]MCT4490758.1 XRE family transcriptional regulator [Levilactobacillus parabrevis]